jgi:hypothetical protein
VIGGSRDLSDIKRTRKADKEKKTNRFPRKRLGEIERVL